MNSVKVERLEIKSLGDIQPYKLNAHLEPMMTSEELYSLGDSLIKSNFSNKANPLILIRVDDSYEIVSGKNRYIALQNINAKYLYARILPQDTEKEAVEGIILMEFKRRDKTKSQKAIGAFRYYMEFKFKENLTYDIVAKRVGVSVRTLSACGTMHRLGRSDILDDIFNGKRFSYETINQHTGEVVTKATTSVEVALKVLKTTQKSVEPANTRNESEEFSLARVPVKEHIINAIQKTNNPEVASLLKDAYEKIVESEQEKG